MKISNPKPLPDCHRCDARAQSAFCGMLKDEVFDLFMQVNKVHLYKKDQALFYEGNTCEAIYLLCAGSVKLVQSSKTGHQQLLEIVSPGGWVDKGSLFSSGRHAATAQALEESTVSLLTREGINRVIASVPDFAHTLITALSREVEKGGERIRLLTSKSAMERLAGVLLDLGDHHGVKSDKGVMIKLRLKREELAEMVCVTQETVVRLLTALKKERIIQLTGKEIHILEEDRLSKICG